MVQDTRVPSFLAAHGMLGRLSAVTCLLLVLAPAVAFGGPASMFIRGDANLDGNVSQADAIFLINHLFQGGPEPRCASAADSDDDDVVGFLDVPVILQFVQDPAFVLPPPFPAPGSDPTPGAVGCADPTLEPAENREDFAITWLSDPEVGQGQEDVEFFAVVSTGEAMEGFSISYEVDSNILEDVRVDLQGTTLEGELDAAELTAFEDSFLFDYSVAPTGDPGLQRLCVTSSYYRQSQNFAPLAFSATAGGVKAATLLRVVANVKPDAPLGEFQILRPLSTELGCANEYSEDGGANFGNAGGLTLLSASIGEFLRGDCTGDLEIDIADPLFLAHEFFASPKSGLSCASACDTDGNETLNMMDILHTLNYLFGTGPAPAEPDEKVANGCQSWTISLGCAQTTCIEGTPIILGEQ